MPRRPRPTSRRPPQDAIIPCVRAKAAPSVPLRNSTSNLKSRSKPSPEEAEADESSTDSEIDSEEFFEARPSDAASSRSGDEEDYFGEDSLDAGHEGAEPDVPRAAQWVDDEDLSDASENESEVSEDEEARKSQLQAGLQSFSFGALRKAQKALAQSSTVSDSDEDSPSDMSVPEEESQRRLDKGKEKEGPSQQRKEVPKRKNKHAPVEMSSKRPVSRSRFVSEEKHVPRDPRFLQVTGDFDAKRFQNQYDFLSDLHRDELGTLKDSLKRARKILANSPRDLREEREREVERLERTVKRAESLVNKDRQERVEMEALRKLAKEEREKRKQGKKAWYMKDAGKKELLLRAKYDALAETGGKGAVRKAIEKKQKKVNQKEKKRRPFAPGQPSGSRIGAGEGPARMKRPHSHSGAEGGSRKRPRPS